MRIQSSPQHTPPTPASAPTPPTPPPPQPEGGGLLERMRDGAEAGAEDWGHMGKKLGSLAAVAYGNQALTFEAVKAMVNYDPGMNPILFSALGLGVGIGTLAAMALEEKHIGIGRTIGGLVGNAAGAVVGGVGGLVAPESKAPPAKIVLPQEMPNGKAAYEPLLLRASHSIQRAVAGDTFKRTKAVEFGENIGATLGTLAMAYTVPSFAAAIPGPIGASMTTILGPLVGMVAGGLEENTLGIGRTVGELVGRAFSDEKAPPPKPKTEPPKDAGLFKKAFLEFNHTIGEPLIGFLVDTTTMANRLFSEAPKLNIAFQDRPTPEVNEKRVLDNFVKLAGMWGPSGHEEKMADHLTGVLQSKGFEVVRKPDQVLVASLPATPGYEDVPTVMLSAHQDTVHETKPESIIVGKRNVHTDGTHVLGADDRAGIAEILEGITVVQEKGLPHGPLKVVFTVDEERGLMGAARLTPDEVSDRPTLGFVVDALDVHDLNLINDAVIVQPQSKKYAFSQEDPLVQVILKSMADAGTKPRVMHTPILTGAGSDANTPAFNNERIHSMAVGAGEQDMHTPNERVNIKDLYQAAKHVVGYITNATDLKVEGDKIVPRQALNLPAAGGDGHH